MLRDVLLSVGIDIGTSTTQVVFSNITIQDMSSGFSVPRIEIIEKEIVYRSDIHFTPLKSPVEIDMAGVRDIVAAEYEKSGMEKSSIQTGAVVITGETARKQNASEVLLHLSDFAGDFVVATAGPDLESIIAARGAGADEYAKLHSTSAANYDIGGGTSNFAMFNRGNLLSTGCLDIGGRLIRVDDAHRTITYIAPKIAALAESIGAPLAVGDAATPDAIGPVVRAMCQMLEMSLGLRPKSAFYPTILSNPGKDLLLPVPLKNICFSGGVADAIYTDQTDADPFLYGDVGILLGREIRSSPLLAEIPRFTAKETIRATVVGAGSHITEISGSTIEYDPELLPVKNVPILKLLAEEEATPAAMREAILKKLDWFRLEDELQLVAVAFAGPKSPSFQQVGEMADAILEGVQPLLQLGLPLITVTRSDLAKVLGQSIRARIPGHKGFICIDSIQVENGDYIDIGSPVAFGTVLPVVIKTLLFR